MPWYRKHSSPQTGWGIKVKCGSFPVTMVTRRSHFELLNLSWKVESTKIYAKRVMKWLTKYHQAKNGIAKVEIYQNTAMVLY